MADAYPRIPTNNAGKVKRFHSFAVAIAAAVVGPPTFALLARYNSFAGSLKINLPMLMREQKCRAICSAEKRNSDGADSMTSRIDPAAPDAAKNICMKTIPIAVPVTLKL